MGLLPDTPNCGWHMCRGCRERFPRHRLQGKPLVSDPGMHNVTHVTIVLYVCYLLWNYFMCILLYMIICMLLSATSTHFKWELMLYCLHCPTLNKVFLHLLLRVVMHVGITNPRWRGKRSRHSRRMRNPQFCGSGKRPMIKSFLSLTFTYHAGF